jgi:hypothetical protein
MFKGTNRKILYIVVITMALLLALSSIAMAAVWTDQADYVPGSVVTISGDNSDGAGYLAGETVHLAVTGPNGYEATCEAVADDAGAWSCQVTLNGDESAVGEYSYIATGQDSGVSQSGTFTDAGSLKNISINDNTVTEGDSGTIVATFTVTVELDKAGGVDVNYTTSNGTATGGTSCSAGVDYVTTSGTLTWIGNEDQSQNISVTICGDTSIETNEIFYVNLTSGSHGTSSFSDSQGQGTINNDDAACETPSITADPVSVTKTVGESVTFSVTASGTTPFSYQWRKGGVDINGATSNSYTINSVVVADASNYTVYISNGCGNVTSNIAELTVNRATPTVIEWPSAGVITYGQALSDSTLMGGSASVSGSFVFTDDAIKPDAGTYSASVTFTPDDTANYNTVISNVNVTVNPKLLTATITVDAKDYDGTTSASIHSCTLSGVVDDEDVACDFSGATATFAKKDAGTWAVSASELTLSGTANLDNYSFDGNGSGTGTINQRVLTATIMVADKYFDYTTIATITGCTMNNVVSGETVGCNYSGATANFNDALAGNGKPVTATGLAMSGDAAVLANYSFDGNGSGTGNILHWRIDGFFPPVDMPYKDAGGNLVIILNTVKNGSTVPLKFKIFAGTTELTNTDYIDSLIYGLTTCNVNAPTDTIETTATGGTSLRYDTVSGQFIFNWKTPNTPSKCYVVTLKTDDGSTLVAFFKLK